MKPKINELAKRTSAIVKPKIFCLSFQRTGTTSTGRFFRDHGYAVADISLSRYNGWSLKWFTGNYEAIFSSFDFRTFQVFEDDPWWCQDFYKVLFHRFPSSKFVLLERDSDQWFDSMRAHSSGRTIGNTHLHAKLYRREQDFYEVSMPSNFFNSSIDRLLPIDEQHREHYISLYELRIREVQEFFSHFGEERLFNCALEDPEKWQKMGQFFKIKVDGNYDVHINQSGS